MTDREELEGLIGAWEAGYAAAPAKNTPRCAPDKKDRTMYSAPDTNLAQDKLAHFLSELHNDNAPIGWEQYRPVAAMLLMKFPISEIVMDERFDDPTFQPGRATN